MGSTAKQRWQAKGRALKQDTLALYLAARHPRTPWYAKVLIGCVAAYVLSPIDLIPDFVPVLGYLDDLILVSAGIALALRLVPPDVMEECRKRAAEAFATDRPVSKTAAAAVILLWVLAAVLIGVLVVRLIGRRPG